MSCAIGIDLGGTNLRVGILDRSGHILAKNMAPTGSDRSANGVITRIAEEVGQIRKTHHGQILAVGCGIPGIVAFDKGMVISSPHFPEWSGVPMRDEISRRIGMPVVLDNDANMYALGEHRFGAGRGCKNMVLLTLGTGIGGGLVLGGDIFHGDEGFAGEVGHIVVEPEGIRCNCGGRGCLEKYAASEGFANLAEKLSSKDKTSLLSRLGCDLSDLTPTLVAKLAEDHDEIALKLWAGFGRYLGVGIATLVNVLGIYTFIIGGGITASWDLFADPLRKEALGHTYKYHASHLIIKRAKLGDDAGIAGAGSRALEYFQL